MTGRGQGASPVRLLRPRVHQPCRETSMKPLALPAYGLSRWEGKAATHAAEVGGLAPRTRA